MQSPPATPQPTPALTVRPMEARDVARWDAFVMSHAEGSFFHRSGWLGIFRDIFGLTPHYLLAERGTESGVGVGLGSEIVAEVVASTAVPLRPTRT